MIREEFQAMAINCTGMWAGFKQTLPSLSEVLAIAAIHFNDPVGSSDLYQIRKHTLPSHDPTNALPFLKF